jgi:hypothetical protein
VEEKLSGRSIEGLLATPMDDAGRELVEAWRGYLVRRHQESLELLA